MQNQMKEHFEKEADRAVQLVIEADKTGDENRKIAARFHQRLVNESLAYYSRKR